ncbi:MAG: Rrf2 family transcriptional regulator [Bifidobacteriaceae bacterium]|jgi:DNA-binding IscR family transcriptional regulator|nr:Rrf2 family transcriptional regulator [Bifidobacteriaceae bacterium]
MRISTKFSDALHLLSFIEVFKSQKITSETIAASINTSPVVVRRLIAELRTAKIIGPYEGGCSPRLAESSKDVTLFDVYTAIEHKRRLFNVDHDTNPRCPVGAHIPDVLDTVYAEAEAAAFGQLRRTTLRDVIDRIEVAHRMEGEVS